MSNPSHVESHLCMLNFLDYNAREIKRSERHKGGRGGGGQHGKNRDHDENQKGKIYVLFFLEKGV